MNNLVDENSVSLWSLLLMMCSIILVLVFIGLSDNKNWKKSMAFQRIAIVVVWGGGCRIRCFENQWRWFRSLKFIGFRSTSFEYVCHVFLLMSTEKSEDRTRARLPVVLLPMIIGLKWLSTYFLSLQHERRTWVDRRHLHICATATVVFDDLSKQTLVSLHTFIDALLLREKCPFDLELALQSALLLQSATTNG